MTASTLSGAEYREVWSSWLTEVFRTRSESERSRTSLVTLTFAPREWECDQIGSTGPTISRVGRAGLRFAEQLSVTLERPSYFGVREIGGWSGRKHLHFLISSPGDAGIRAAMRLHEVKEGFVTLRSTDMAPCDYVTKYVSKSDGDWWVAGGPLFGVQQRGCGSGGGVELSGGGGRSVRPELGR